VEGSMMTDTILGLACIVLGVVFIIQQVQIAMLRKNVFKLDDILLNTMKQIDAVQSAVEDLKR
jgi:cell division protein FtsL